MRIKSVLSQGLKLKPYPFYSFQFGGVDVLIKKKEGGEGAFHLYGQHFKVSGIQAK